MDVHAFASATWINAFGNYSTGVAGELEVEQGKYLLTSRLGGPTSAFLISEAGGNKCGVVVRDNTRARSAYMKCSFFSFLFFPRCSRELILPPIVFFLDFVSLSLFLSS